MFLKPNADFSDTGVEKTEQISHWIADFSRYEKYDVKLGFYKYGGKVYLTVTNDKPMITKIEYQGHIYDGDNELMNYIVRSTLCIVIVMEMHYITSCLKISQTKAVNYMNCFKFDDPISDLLYMLSFNVLKSNRKLSYILDFDGLLNKLFAFTQSSYIDLLEQTIESQTFDIYGSKGTKWNEQMVNYSDKVRSFVREIVPDDIVHEITYYMVTVTAFHNQTGDAQVFSLIISDFLLPKVYKAKPGSICTQDRKIISALIQRGTFPQLNDSDLGKKIFRLKGHEQAWERFRLQIDKDPEVNWFVPKYFEVSAGH